MQMYNSDMPVNIPKRVKPLSDKLQKPIPCCYKVNMKLRLVLVKI